MVSCPLGSLQASLAGKDLGAFFYVAGMLALFGSLFGRFVCGWICPFGLLQELLYKIPLVPKRGGFAGGRHWEKCKYLLLVLFCLILPLFACDSFGYGKDWFCAYLCPAGALEGGLLYAVWNKSLRVLLSWLFAWKMALLAALVFGSMVVFRPMCRYFCPLGALYGLGNHISPLILAWKEGKCIHCGMCARFCPMELKPASPGQKSLCIRCGKCVHVCPKKALSLTIRPDSAPSVR